MINKTLIGLIDLLLAVSAYATEKHPLHVYADISANSLIQSGLLKRLRALKDVEIMAHIEDAESGFLIGAISIKNVRDNLMGYAISVVYAEAFPVYSGLFKTGPQDSRPYPENKPLTDFLDKDRKGRAVLQDMNVYTCNPQDLDHTLDEIVADFDVKMLEPQRKTGLKAISL
jgi:hypothetical protein